MHNSSQTLVESQVKDTCYMPFSLTGTSCYSAPYIGDMTYKPYMLQMSSITRKYVNISILWFRLRQIFKEIQILQEVLKLPLNSALPMCNYILYKDLRLILGP
ncbi:hypothetical protein XENOCAPTIV_012959 [Xenoophorus captivus]|uniref:Uncharacterized protein n=1 Tax=Xenoophorus captivus TaxID=1517983 RepID=A0ABV0SFX4_9TELE